MSAVHLAAFAVGCLVLAVLARRRPGTFFRRAGRFGLFIVLLLLAGSAFSGLWSCLVWGRFYWSADYVFDFTSFWPITRDVIDSTFAGKRGQLNGVSLHQLQLVWLLFACCTWAVSVFSYRRLRPGGTGPRQEKGQRRIQ